MFWEEISILQKRRLNYSKSRGGDPVSVRFRAPAPFNKTSTWDDFYRRFRCLFYGELSLLLQPADKLAGIRQIFQGCRGRWSFFLCRILPGCGQGNCLAVDEWSWFLLVLVSKVLWVVKTWWWNTFYELIYGVGEKNRIFRGEFVWLGDKTLLNKRLVKSKSKSMNPLCQWRWDTYPSKN